MDSFLNEEEKARLVRFNVDKATKDVVEKVLLYFIYNAEILKKGKPAGIEENWVYGVADAKSTDEEVGRRVRTKIDALGFLKKAWDQIGGYMAEVEPDTIENNPAL